MKQNRTALKPDAQAFDEIRIVTVPRYKTSGLSGDEWRISARTEFWRKGHKVHEVYHGNIEKACILLGHDLWQAQDAGLAFFGGGEHGACDQEGCTSPATVFYKLKKEFSREGYEHNPYEFDQRPLTRGFCERHSTRGDCGLEDSDGNYERLEGIPSEPHAQDIKESVFGGVMPMNPQDAN